MSARAVNRANSLSYALSQGACPIALLVGDLAVEAGCRLANSFAAGDQSIGDLRDMPAPKAGDGELVLAWLA
jgi:hypothetical protein